MNELMLISQGLIFLPIIISILVYLLNRKVVTYLLFPVQSILTYMVIRLWFMLEESGRLTYTLGGWDNNVGIELCIDGLSWMFILMAVIIWWVILIYSWQQKASDFKFLFFLMFLEGCFLGLLQVNDFFSFFVLVEVITILSAILILYKKDGISLKAGLYYLLFNSMGMVIYLFGVILLYFKTGTLNMTVISHYLSTLSYSTAGYSLLHVSFACIMVAMCVKAALFPVYEWLPRAHTAAPAYISALLSGLLVKTGLYGLIRILQIFDAFDISELLFYLGLFTAISGIVFAVSQKDIKAILAFHTISQIGLIMMSFAYGSSIGYVGAYLHIFNHFLFKSLLFLGAGILINEYGLRRVTDIRGILRAHPIFSMMMIVAILSITGSPFFIGFISKTMMKMSSINVYHEWLFRLVSLGTIVSFIKFSQIFIGKPKFRIKIPLGPMLGCTILFIFMIGSYFTEIDMIEKLYLMDNDSLPDTLSNGIYYVKHALFDINYLIEFIVMVMIGFIIFKLLIRSESRFWYSIRHFRVKFQDAILSLAIFLSIIIGYVS